VRDQTNSIFGFCITFIVMVVSLNLVAIQHDIELQQLCRNVEKTGLTAKNLQQFQRLTSILRNQIKKLTKEEKSKKEIQGIGLCFDMEHSQQALEFLCLLIRTGYVSQGDLEKTYLFYKSFFLDSDYLLHASNVEKTFYVELLILLKRSLKKAQPSSITPPNLSSPHLYFRWEDSATILLNVYGIVGRTAVAIECLSDYLEKGHLDINEDSL